jgi:hypothetical protein
MYDSYLKYVQTITFDNINQSNFKNNSEYNGILEHVSREQGLNYLKLINVEFSDITVEQIVEFSIINDRYGKPKKEVSISLNNTEIQASATSIRYIYHALLILKHYKYNTSSEIVEVGCGYGGLFLAVCFFSRILNIKIDKYYFIDLPHVCNLINNYLLINKHNISINYEIHGSNNFENKISNNNLFFISNYCFTEINEEYRNNYIKYLLPNVSCGFMVWQTVFGFNIENAYKLFKVKNITEELPQTASIQHKNYFVYF